MAAATEPERGKMHDNIRLCATGFEAEEFRSLERLRDDRGNQNHRLANGYNFGVSCAASYAMYIGGRRLAGTVPTYLKIIVRKCE
jgi:hypothetical protein